MPARTARREPAIAPRTTARARAKNARHEAYRDLVLEAAGSAFALRGVPNTKMEELAEQAGLSLGTLYSVYKGKAEIVDALHEARLREIHSASIEAESVESNPLDALLAGSRAYVAYFIEHPDYLKMYIDEGTNWGVRDSMGRESRRAAVWGDGVAHLAEIFERGIASGVFESGRADRLARTMLAMQQVQLADWLEEDMQTSPDAVMAEVETLIRRAFCTDDWRVPAADPPATN